MKHRILIEFEARKPLPADFTDMVLNRVYTLDAVDKTECTTTLVDDFSLRGELASLKCWHRLTHDESHDLIDFFAKQGTK